MKSFFGKIFLALLLVLLLGLSVGCHKNPVSPKMPIPPGYTEDGQCAGDAFDVHGVPSVITCKDKKGNLVGVYKRQ